MTRLAFVTPWYGADIPGGAEAEARRTAERLNQAGLKTEILTTCVKDFYADWGRNYHKAGTDSVNGITVRRFAVEERDHQAFDHVNWRLMNGLPITLEQERIYISEMIRAPALYDYIAKHAQEYLYIFIPYLFATSYFGAQIAPKRSIMIPCLHDESYARLGLYQEVIPEVRGLILHTEAERELAERLFGLPSGQIRGVLGEGVDTGFSADGDRFREKYRISGPFVLYAGRREPGKNTPLLIEYWQRYLRSEQRPANLVLIGSGVVALPQGNGDHILDLGFVPVQDKLDAYAAAHVFCMPSVHESFSIAIMESWVAGTPVLVHGACASTREHCQKASGGLYFTNFDEFSATLNFLLDHPEMASKLGRQGRRYVLENYRWDIVIAKYRRFIGQVMDS